MFEGSGERAQLYRVKFQKILATFLGGFVLDGELGRQFELRVYDVEIGGTLDFHGVLGLFQLESRGDCYQSDVQFFHLHLDGGFAAVDLNMAGDFVFVDVQSR